MLAAVVVGSRRAEPATGVAILRPWKEVPPVSSSMSAGVGWLSYDPVSRVLTYAIETNVTSVVTGLHLHRPSLGDKLFLSTTGWGATPPLDPMWGTAILAGHTYINVHTADFPDGEVRGDVHTATTPDPEGDSNLVLFAALALDDFETVRVPSAAGPTSRAVGVVLYDSVSGDASVVTMPARSDVTGVHVHLGSFGSDGSNECNLLAETEGFCPGLNQGILQSGGYYFNFHVGGPGYMRGQIDPLDATISASGFNLVGELEPGPAGHFAGLATASYTPRSGGSALSFSIYHNVSAPSSLAIGSHVVCVGSMECASPVTGVLDGPFNVSARSEIYSSPGMHVIITSGAPNIVAAQGYLGYGGQIAGQEALQYASELSFYDAQLVLPPSPNTAGGAVLVTYTGSASLYRFTVGYFTNAIGNTVDLALGVNGRTGRIADSYVPLATSLSPSGVVSGVVDLSSVGGTTFDGAMSFSLWTPSYPSGAGIARGSTVQVRPTGGRPATHIS